MSVKKTAKAENKEVKVEVKEETKVSKDTKTVEVEVDNEPKVEVDNTPVKPKEVTDDEKIVRIRLREDHKCWVNHECYEFLKGKCYNVPESVKKRLNKAGVLSPL